MTKMLRSAATSAAMIGALAAATSPIPDDLRHFALSKSAPEADASVPSPSEVRLWFTEEPQEGTTSIRVVGAEDAGVHVDEVTKDPEEATSFAVALHGTLPAGSYTVSWRGMGQDGHVVRDSFDFTVVAR